MHPLKQYLQDVDEKIQDFAQRIGASRQTLYRMFSGVQTPKPVLARRIVEATGGAVTLEMLYSGKREGFADLVGYMAEQQVDPPLDVERLQLALSMAVNQMRCRRSQPPTPELLACSAEVSVAIYSALSPLTSRDGQDRIEQALRPAFEELMRGSGRLPSHSTIDKGVALSVELYEELGAMQRREQDLRTVKARK